MFPYWDLASIISPPCTASDFVRTRGGLGQDTRHTRGSFPTRLGPTFAQLMHSNHPLRRLHSLQTSQYIRYIRDPKGILEKFDSKWNVTYDRKQICSEMYAIAKTTHTCSLIFVIFAIAFISWHKWSVLPNWETAVSVRPEAYLSSTDLAGKFWVNAQSLNLFTESKRKS